MMERRVLTKETSLNTGEQKRNDAWISKQLSSNPRINRRDYSVWKGTSGNDELLNEGRSVSIYGGKGNDTIENYGDDVFMSGEAGDDFIGNGGMPYSAQTGRNSEKTGQSVTIKGGSGNDTITNLGQESVLYGGNQDDIIMNGFFYSPENSGYCYIYPKLPSKLYT